MNTPFTSAWNTVAAEVNATAHDKGWYENPSEDGTRLMLMVSEIVEAMEALRVGNPPDDKIPEFSGAEAELADCVVRILDMSHEKGWRVAEALEAKRAYNKTRAHKHGGKLF